jgi:N-acetylglutamate synthase-like GNAT family acetyltransferase
MIAYREVLSSDKEWVKEFITRHWGSNKIVVHKSVYYPNKLNGFLAEDRKKKIGLITYKIEKDGCEIVTLNSVKQNKGVGTQLVKLVLSEAKKRKCKNIWLITTNDNIKAICFYQKLGFKLIKVYADVVKESRKIKPEIPMIAENGIPIRDELEFRLKI